MTKSDERDSDHDCRMTMSDANDNDNDCQDSITNTMTMGMTMPDSRSSCQQQPPKASNLNLLVCDLATVGLCLFIVLVVYYAFLFFNGYLW